MNRLGQPILSAGIVGLVLCSVIGCGDDGGPTGPETSDITVAISPTSTTLEVGETQQFTAAVNGTSQPGVTWKVASGLGAISTDGLYTAPSSIEQDSVTATVQATADADSNATDTAVVTVKRHGPGSVIVTISPLTATVVVGQTQQFSATVTGASDGTVSWVVSTGPGSISQTGLYTAPNSIEGDSVSATIRATANAAPNPSAVAVVTVTAGSAGSEGDAVRSGYFGSQDIHELAEANAELCVEAVYLASELGGGGQVLITTGTLTQNVSGTYSYSSTPQDRLRIVFSNGISIDLFVSTLDGDFELEAEDFLSEDHQIVFRVVGSEELDLSISSIYAGGNSQASISGTFTYESTVYTANLTEIGTYWSDVSAGGAESSHEETTTGTVTAPGFSMTVNETYWFYAIYVSDLIQNVERTSNNTFTSGSNSYQFSNIVIRKSFINYSPAELDSYWLAQGALIKNGALHGQVGWGVESSEIKTWLDTPSERIILETWGL